MPNKFVPYMTVYSLLVKIKHKNPKAKRIVKYRVTFHVLYPSKFRCMFYFRFGLIPLVDQYNFERDGLSVSPHYITCDYLRTYATDFLLIPNKDYVSAL